MTPVEHSRMLYLLDALQACPLDAETLLRMAERQGSSPDYVDLISALRKCSHGHAALKRACRAIREGLR